MDTSVLLATLLAEDRRPPERLWDQSLVSSRVLEVETIVRLRALGRTDVAPAATLVLRRVGFVEMEPTTLAPVFELWPIPVRALDAIHLAAALHLARNGVALSIATYDRRLAEAALALELGLLDLS